MADVLRQVFISRCTSPASAGFLFVEKNDGVLCSCIELSVVTVKYPHQCPLISLAIEQLLGSTWFTRLDLHSAYNLVRIRAGDE